MNRTHFRFPFPRDIKIWAAIAIVLACLEGAFWSYQNLYQETPDYSFQQLVTAAAQGDTATVQRYVDEEAITGQIFDSIVQETNDLSPTLPGLALTWTPLKAEVTTLGQQVLQTYLAGQSEDDAQAPTYQALQNRLRSLQFPIPLKGWQYAGHQWSTLTGPGTATVTAEFYNTTLQCTIPVTFTLERQTSTTWKLVGLANPSATLEAIQAAYTSQLAKKNEPIQRQIDQIVTITDVTSTLLSDAAGAQRYVRIQYTPSFQTNRQDIDEIKGTYTLRRSDDQAVLYSTDIRLSTASEKATYVTQFLLNPLIPSQFKLSQRQNLDGTTSTLAITSVRLKNGQEYTLDTQVTAANAAKME